MVAIISKERAIDWLVQRLEGLGVDEKVVEISRRESELYPFPPPGMDTIVTTRC